MLNPNKASDNKSQTIFNQEIIIFESTLVLDFISKFKLLDKKKF